jgi:hypothetical protein
LLSLVFVRQTTEVATKWDSNLGPSDLKRRFAILAESKTKTQ